MYKKKNTDETLIWFSLDNALQDIQKQMQTVDKLDQLLELHTRQASILRAMIEELQQDKKVA